MYDTDCLIKFYFTIVNVVGYFIIFVSNMSFYTNPEFSDIRWIISSFIGTFIVVFKNTKMKDSKYKFMYYYFDIAMIFIILFITKSFPSQLEITKTIMICFILFIYLYFYTSLVFKNKITFEE